MPGCNLKHHNPYMPSWQDMLVQLGLRYMTFVYFHCYFWNMYWVAIFHSIFCCSLMKIYLYFYYIVSNQMILKIPYDRYTSEPNLEYAKYLPPSFLDLFIFNWECLLVNFYAKIVLMISWRYAFVWLSLNSCEGSKLMFILTHVRKENTSLCDYFCSMKCCMLWVV